MAFVRASALKERRAVSISAGGDSDGLLARPRLTVWRDQAAAT